MYPRANHSLQINLLTYQETFDQVKQTSDSIVHFVLTLRFRVCFPRHSLALTIDFPCKITFEFLITNLVRLCKKWIRWNTLIFVHWNTHVRSFLKKRFINHVHQLGDGLRWIQTLSNTCSHGNNLFRWRTTDLYILQDIVIALSRFFGTFVCVVLIKQPPSPTPMISPPQSSSNEEVYSGCSPRSISSITRAASFDTPCASPRCVLCERMCQGSLQH